MIQFIQQRLLENFQKFTVPILEYYHHSDRLLTIDGESNPEVVTQEIVTQLQS